MYLIQNVVILSHALISIITLYVSFIDNIYIVTMYSYSRV